MTSLGGIPIDIDALGVDAAGSCSQKCIGAPPGLGPITDRTARDGRGSRAQEQAVDVVPRSRRCSFSTGAKRAASRTRAFHHTAPIASIYGFHEALRLILEEGLEARWARHRRRTRRWCAGSIASGLSLFPPAANRCATINVINVPAGVDEAKVRRRLLDMGVEMGGGLGALAGKVWRVGVMGYNAQVPRVERFVGALEEALRAEGWTVRVRNGVGRGEQGALRGTFGNTADTAWQYCLGSRYGPPAHLSLVFGNCTRAAH